LVQYLLDENVSRIAQKSTTKKNNAGVSMETKHHISLVGFENQKRNYSITPRKAKKEQISLRRAVLEKKVAAKRTPALQEVSLSGAVLEDDDESLSNKLLEVAADALTTTDDEKSSQSKKTSGESGASKRKSSASASSSKASPTPTKCRKMLSKHAKTPKARTEIDAETCSEPSGSEPSDQDDDKRKPAAVAWTSSWQLLLPAVLVASREDDGSEGEDMAEQPLVLQEDIAQLSAELRAVFIKTKEQLVRAEHQVRAISKTRITVTFLEGQVCTWTKATLWKMWKFITNYQTMHQVMQKASEHFKVPALDQEHWMLSFTHVIRDGLNQKRNACSQDLRKTIKSKCCELHLFC
jgi:hypothetical protein